MGLIAYLISVNDKLKLDENLKKYRGPVVISEVYYKPYKNIISYNYNIGDWEWSKPEIDKNLYFSVKGKISDSYMLNRFLELETTLKNELKK